MIYPKLQTFLNKHPKKDKHTHSIYGGGDIDCGGSYDIPNDKMSEFYKLLSKALFRDNNKISIVEKVQDISRLVIDLDFKYKDHFTERQYNENVLKRIINDIFRHIENVYDISNEQKICWVMEKDKILDAPQKKYKSKDGLHFLFPYIIAQKKTYRVLREKIIESDYSSYFKEEGFTPPSNSMSEIIDDNIYKGGNWFIYGSGKPNEIVYKLTKILKLSDDNLINMPLDLYLDNPCEIIELNSVRMQDEINVGYKECLKKSPSTSSLSSKTSIEDIDREDINPLIVCSVKKHDIEVAKKLALILSSERASNYKEWLDVGYCLHTVSPSLLSSWIAFSKKWPMYNNSSECEKQWNWFHKNNNKNITIGSLNHWAKLDDYDSWKNITRDSVSTLINRSVGSSGSHADVANVIYHYFKDCFVCSEIKTNSWYYFNELNGGKWEETETGHILRSRLSNEIVELYDYHGRKFQEKAKEIEEKEDEDAAKPYDDKHTKCLKIQIQLKDSNYKDKIMKECKDYFYDKDFQEKLNEKKNLLGFENGIYDLNDSIFRGGLPSDYVSLSTGIKFPIAPSDRPLEFSSLMDHVRGLDDYEELNEGLEDFLSKVFPIEEVREYTMRFLSSCLSGEIREEKFYFWTGSGGNGKSKLVELLDFTLGDYSRSMDVSFLTSKRGSSSAASPELENVKNARFVYMSEPEKEDVIYVGKLKQMTGGDKMTSRGLFKSTTQFKPQFKIVLMCNDLPHLGGNDGGIWRRIEVVKYISKFSDNPRPTKTDPHQFEADLSLTAKLEKWNLIFMMKLLEKYQSYDKEGTQPPPQVKEETKLYKTSSDIFANWFDDYIEETDEFSSFEELYDGWEEHCDDIGIDKRNRLAKTDLKKELLKEQEKTEHGLVLGKKLADGAANGTERKPRFNFRIMED
tara:strand:+ start:5975 stop:8710 length:2736 start_codon:yes stop_codon:yes gene_type:complete